MSIDKKIKKMISGFNFCSTKNTFIFDIGKFGDDAISRVDVM